MSQLREADRNYVLSYPETFTVIGDSNHALELISARSSALRVNCRTRENVEGTLFLPNKSLSARVAACQTSEADHLVLQRIVPIRRLARMRVARRPLT